MRVWIDQDLCTSDGICGEICPDIFFDGPDGLYYVREVGDSGLDADGQPKLKMATGTAYVPDALMNAAIEAAEDRPGECIFFSE